MKRAKSMVGRLLLAVLIAGGMCGVGLNAQSETGEIFTVPFAFTVDGQEIQPGIYELRRDSNQFLISIRNVKTGEKQLFSVRPEERSAVPAKGLLVFERCGDRKELSEFHIRGTNFYSATIAVGRRKNLEAESCSRSDAVTLAAR